MKEKHPVIQGTIILTLSGILSRMIGFYNRILLSRVIGAKEIGIYQMIFPVYLFCFAICCQGFEAGLSQLVAAGKAVHKEGNCSFLLKMVTLLCVFLSLLTSICLFLFSGQIAVILLHTPSAASCLKIAAIAVPFVSLKGCIHGYYIGCGNPKIPSLCQLTEQITRVGSIMLIAYTVLFVKCSGAKLAVVGMTIGEITSCLLSVYFILKEHPLHAKPESSRMELCRQFFKISLPLSGNRISLTLLQSAEAILIPHQMLQFYLDQSLSLELYGILTGIALPFLFFPSTITNSLATMLLPSISADHQKHDKKHMMRTISLTTYGGFFMGLCFLSIFFLFGPWLGRVIFHSTAAGEYLKMLSFLCPALYLSTIFTSILNGMGKTKETFFHNIISILIRLLFIYLAIPKFGIDGYIWGLLISTFALVILNYLEIQKEI
jgi:stage V sporulation protein B